MKILIVSASFYPENSPRSFRTTELAMELSRQRHKLTVLIPNMGFDYSDFEIEHNLKIRNFGYLKWKKSNSIKSAPRSIFRRIIDRILLILFEWPDIELTFKISKALKNENGYDQLISIAYPHSVHWGVAKARNKKRKIANCWVADCGDPFMGNNIDSFNKLFYFKYVEKWFCRKADYITIPFEGAREAYYPEFQGKIKIIPQGVRLDELNLPAYKKTTGCPVFAYAGGFIPGKRDPDKILDFLGAYEHEFKFIVYTNQKDLLSRHKDVLGDKLEIRDYIPRVKLLKVLSGMDFLINFDNNNPRMLPSKLIDYAITGRPVLNINSDSNFEDLADFLEGNYENRLILDPPENFDIRLIAKNFTKLHST